MFTPILYTAETMTRLNKRFVETCILGKVETLTSA